MCVLVIGYIVVPEIGLDEVDCCIFDVGLDVKVVLASTMPLVGSLQVVLLMPQQLRLFYCRVQMDCNSASTPILPFHFYALLLFLVSSLIVHFLLGIVVPQGAAPFSYLVHQSFPERKEERELLDVLVGVHMRYWRFSSLAKVLYLPIRSGG